MALLVGPGSTLYGCIASNIVKIALENGGVLTNDLFKVNLEMTQTINHEGDVVNKYKVGDVLEFRKGQRQADMFLEYQQQLAPDEEETEE